MSIEFERQNQEGESRPFYLRFLELLTSNGKWSHGYETLVINLSRPPSHGLRTILITSAQPGEGKTTVAANLALAMVLAGKRVTLVDADLRRPGVELLFHDRESLPGNGRRVFSPGLADVLAGRCSESDVVRTVPVILGDSREPRTLRVVPSGCAAPGRFAVLESHRLEEALRFWREKNDVVVVDAPPVLAVSDPLLIAPRVDGVILVIGAGVVTEREARRTKAALEGAGGRLAGAVMNRFEEKVHGPGYHPYSSYYESNGLPR